MLQYEKMVNEMVHEYQSNTVGPWVVAWSGGKDSSLLLHATFDALYKVPPKKRIRLIKILTNDTLVESPFVSSYLYDQISSIEKFLSKRSLPVEIAVSIPRSNDTFWTNVIGKGYPAPTRHFRWCTDRLKIRPTVSYIKDITKSAGSSVLLLGVRRSESSQRAKTAARFDGYGRLNPHDSLAGCQVYRPILEWSTDDVWEFLASSKPRWGKSYKPLIELYRNAVGGECPVVLDPDAAPSCGSSSIRFGCWTCTVVAKDKSLKGSIENTDGRYEPLADFRDWLKVISADKTRRMGIRRNGRQGLGPMTIALRREILRKLLKAQKLVQAPLISNHEIEEIKRIWRVDAKMFEAYFAYCNQDSEEQKNELSTREFST